MFVRGTKRKRRDGVWELRVYVGRDPVTGTPRQLSRTFRGGSRAADGALRELVDKYGEAQQDGFGATFSQLLDRWLEESERMDLSPTTMRTYRAQVEQIIRPRLGKVALVRLTPKHLDDLYGQMKEEGRSPKTIRNYHAIISSALHQGVRWEWVRENVAEKAKPPRVSQQRITAGRVRIVALDEVGVALLIRHRANVDDWAQHAEVAVTEDAHVFSHAVDGSKPFRPDNVTGFFTRVRDSLGLREVRLHDLRHFTATQLIGAGVDVRTVAGRLGHSDPSVTLRVYSHALEDRDRAAAVIMGRVLGPTGKKPITLRSS